MQLVKQFRQLTVLKQICLIILLFYLLVALFAPLLMPYKVSDFSHPSLAAPCSDYLLGTDEMGHDIFSLLLNGFRISVMLALAAGSLSTLLGTVLAFLACYFGGWVKELLTGTANLFLIVPELVLIMFIAVFTAPTTANTIGVIVFFSWARVFKIILGKLMDCMEKSKVQYTLMLKGNIFDVMRKLLPDVAPLLKSFFALQCNRAIMYETTLAFFGIGDPLAKSWGKLIRSAMDYANLYYDNTFLWYLLPPILAVVIFVISISLLVMGEGNRAAALRL